VFVNTQMDGHSRERSTLQRGFIKICRNGLIKEVRKLSLSVARPFYFVVCFAMVNLMMDMEIWRVR